MSNYPNWWSTTVTLYNKYENPTTREIKWYRKVLTNCFWRYTGERIVIGETSILTDNAICRVRKNDNFKPSYEWQALSDSEKATYFTFNVGDIIINGTASDTIDEYTSGSRSSDILKKYKASYGCMTISKCVINVGTGLDIEHYHITGV